MRFVTRIAALALAAALQACVTPPVQAPAPAVTPATVAETRTPVTILISIDGMRPDYLDRGVTPNLARLAADGVRAAMRPSFPSTTFPNHHTLVTGVRPDRHGIVANRFENPDDRKQIFTMQSDQPFWWASAEPIWVTAEKAGIRTATMFWPGSNVDFGGVRPQDWIPFGQQVSGRQRVDQLIDWLRRPAAERPRFLTTYFDVVDSAGHDSGPDSAAVNRALADVDSVIGRLIGRLGELGQPANLIVVADHGMAATHPDRVIRLYEQVPATVGRFVYGGPYAGIEAVPGQEAALAALLRTPRAHLNCWPRAEIPAALHYGRNPRTPGWLCLADPGWLVIDRPPPPDRPIARGGTHGYDPAAPDMAAIFIAHGPAFRAGVTLPAFDNVDVAPLLRRLMRLPADSSADGTAATFDSALIAR